ncbi:MAG: FAD-dependent oxidoreductase [Halanaerobiaceae bacterium]|nr:FAD-dependent oxidoreductase [Halanaerobiaceae bacterium]
MDNKISRRIALGLLGVVVVLVLVFFLSDFRGNETEAFSYKAGTYTAEAKGFNGNVKVKVVLNNDEIVSVEILEHNETEAIGGNAMEAIADRIVKEQSLAIDAVSGATISCKAVLAAVEECIKKAGGNVAALKEKKDDQSNVNIVKMSTDVVVVGAGGAGSSAAVTAQEYGAKVVLLEKNAVPGGTTAMGGGLFGANSSLMEENGEEPIDIDALFQDWMKEMAWKADANLIRKFLELSTTTIDWLIDHGFEIHKSPPIQQTHDAYHGYHKYDDFTKTTQHFIKMLEDFEEKGGQVFYETPARKLIVDESGAVVGVIAEKKDGTILEISAKSVVIATGGFVGAEEWVQETLGGVFVEGAGLVSNVGDGIKMAWEIGAAHRGENVHLLHVTKIPGDLSMYPATSRLVNSSLAYLPINPWVNAAGERFANEDIIYDRALTTNAVVAQGNFVYTVFSQNMLDTLEEKGAAALGMQDKVAMGPIEELTPMNAPWTNLNAMVNELIKQGVAFKGDTYQELARNAGMDVDKFVKSMKRYNEDAEKGKDTLFGKRKEHMVPLGDGPYYAFKVVPTNLCTLGGIRVNSDLQVVRNDPDSYKPIPNLYAAGADAGGLYSDHYVLLEGGAMSWAYNSGRLAGASAASNALNIEIDLFSQ